MKSAERRRKSCSRRRDFIILSVSVSGNYPKCLYNHDQTKPIRLHPFATYPHSFISSNPLSKMSIFGPLGLSFAPQIKKSRTLYRWFKPLADWYVQAAGYRKMGLKYDDLRMCRRLCHLLKLWLTVILIQSLKSGTMSKRWDEELRSSVDGVLTSSRPSVVCPNASRMTAATASSEPHKPVFSTRISRRNSGLSLRRCGPFRQTT